MGARFRYEGVEYVKTGPLFATGPHGQRMIPRYAVLDSLESARVTTLALPEASLAPADVLASFERFCAAIDSAIDGAERDKFEAACRAFLDSLGLEQGG